MEKSLSNCKNLDIILNLHIRETLFSAFKTLQGFGDSRKITGLNLDKYSSSGDNNSIMISALSFNVNSVNYSVINSEKSENYSVINSEKLKDIIPIITEKNKKQSNSKNKSEQIDSFFNKIVSGEKLKFDEEDTKTINFSINTDVADLHIVNSDKNKKFKENKILDIKKEIDEENDKNSMIKGRKKSCIKKSLTTMGRGSRGNDNKVTKKSNFLNDKLFEFDEISDSIHSEGDNSNSESENTSFNF